MCPWLVSSESTRFLSKEFYAQVNFLQNLGYSERRRVLWHRHKPRLRRFLYKFRVFDAMDATSIDRVRDIVIENRLRLSPPGELNDPFDIAVNVIIDGTAEISERLTPLLKKIVKGWEARQRETRRFLQSAKSSHRRLKIHFGRPLLPPVFARLAEILEAFWHGVTMR